MEPDVMEYRALEALSELDATYGVAWRHVLAYGDEDDPRPPIDVTSATGAPWWAAVGDAERALEAAGMPRIASILFDAMRERASIPDGY